MTNPADFFYPLYMHTEFDIPDEVLSLLGISQEEAHTSAQAETLPEPVTPLPYSLDYPPNLPKDLALSPHAEADVLSYYGITPEQYELISSSLTFRRDLSRWRQEVTKEGYTLKLKGLGMAEEHLPILAQMLTNVDTPAAVKVKIFELVLGLGGVTTKAETAPATQGKDAQPQVNIQINLS